MPKTLFHFFSPKASKSEKSDVSSPKSTKTPLKQKNVNVTPKSVPKSSSITKFCSPASQTEAPQFQLYDIVWAKLEGYPWWPSIVCYDPKDSLFKKKENSKNYIHVQFFDVPVTHAWIDARFVDKYEGSDSTGFEIGGKFYSKDQQVIKATKEADEALKKGEEDRKKVLFKFDDSSDEFDDGLDEMLVDESNKIDGSIEEDPAKRPKRAAAKKSTKKRRRIETNSDCSCSEDEFIPPKDAEESEDDLADEAEESSDAPTDSEPEDSPIKDSRKRKRSQINKTPSPASSSKISPSSTPGVSAKLGAFTPNSDTSLSKTPSLSHRTKSRLSLFQSTDCDVTSSTESQEQNKYLHETLEFLFPDKIKDKYGRKRDDPEYDPTTLKVPDWFLKKLTPAMYQWWKLKIDYFDVIFFFKVGKFYELYHMDAVVGVNELGLIYMKGNFAHSGFPEVAFGRYSENLVQKGYKIARVEQTETPEQNAIRVKKEAPPKQERTLRREICRIITKGTQSLGSWPMKKDMRVGSNFLLAITERQLNSNNSQEGAKSNQCREFGVCFIDTSVGVFNVGQFPDDRHCSSLCTMLSHFTPCQILYEKGQSSFSFQKILRSGLSSILQEPLNPGSQFWDATKTIKNIKKEKYFVKNGEEIWPDALKKMMKDEDAVTLSASRQYELAISALGGCIFYLQKCLFDYEVLTMKQFIEYKPPQTENSPQNILCKLDEITNFVKARSKMILDSVTLTNLEILENSSGGKEGTLLEKLDNCKTSFGKRLLRQWLCSPPCDPEVSSDRLDALEDLMGCQDFVSECQEILKVMPDLERMLMKIHSLSKGCRKPEHPDNRAVLYEEEKYSRRKIEDFLSILKNYESVHNLLTKNQDLIKNFKSGMLRKILCLQQTENGIFPNMEATLKRWKTAFNHKKALESGKITPNHGANPDYDNALQEIQNIQAELENYLKEQKKALQCSSVTYKGSGNKRYQLEMPIEAASRVKSSEYIISGQRKGFKSFKTEETVEFLKNMESAEARRDAAQSETMSIIFREFDQDFAMWNAAVQCLSTLDVLISMTHHCKNSDTEMCRPIIEWHGDATAPFLDIRNGRHPSVTQTFFGDDFIPNDTLLGYHGDGGNPNCLVLTGPNMGGKSTLMRQVGLIVVLAQLGCYVPAEYCKMSPVDRVFTRLGASDRIMSGESTFYVELSETSAILKHATKHSLVLLDELGRGTATYDGTAIALAVVKEISSNTRCRTIFSTHYHTVVDDLAESEDVFQGHMACMVENEDADNDDPSKETLTFLYKLTDGPCPKSYGFHAARLADVPESVITLARRKAAELESNSKCMTAFRRICSAKDLSQIQNILPESLD